MATVCLPYVAYFVFLRDVWIRTQRAAVASRRATNLDTHLSWYSGLSNYVLFLVCYSCGIWPSTPILSSRRAPLRKHSPICIICTLLYFFTHLKISIWDCSKPCVPCAIVVFILFHVQICLKTFLSEFGCFYFNFRKNLTFLMLPVTADYIVIKLFHISILAALRVAIEVVSFRLLTNHE